MILTRIFSSRFGSVLGVCAIVLFGYVGWIHTLGAQTDAGRQQTKGPPAIPVTIQSVQNSDFPVYLNGLGTVQPYNTVTVRSRVDGQVIKVGFRQGQMVSEGDLLVQIDPRPFQAALEQAQAKKAQDEANLKNAQLDLQRYNTLAVQDYASRQQLDTQQAKVDQLVAQIKGISGFAFNRSTSDSRCADRRLSHSWYSL
jgi:multidrug efflux system membrane fusion protein